MSDPATVARVRQYLVDGVPFNHMVGLRVVAADDASVEMELAERPDLLNHVGTMHAAAQFGLGEASAGALIVAALGDLVAAGAIPLLAEATIAYRKPAGGTLRAHASLDGATRERVHAEFTAAGKARVAVAIRLTDAGGAETTTLETSWALIQRRS